MSIGDLMQPCVSCGKEGTGKYGILDCCLECYENYKILDVISYCCMCKEPFKKEHLDFLERCDECFKLFMIMPEEDRPKLGVPYMPIYNGDK
jgi:hypothetical protein